MSNADDPWAAMPLDGPSLLAALAEHERRAAVLAMGLRRFETCGGWAADGSVSIAAWLRQHARMSHSTAHRWVRRGRFLDKFAAIADAAASGRLSEGHVDALHAVCTRRLDDLMAAHQSALVTALAALPVADAELAAHRWQQRAEAGDGTPPRERDRYLDMGRAGDGALLGRFALGDAAGTQLEQAILTATTYEGTDDARTAGERRADALGDVAAFFNRNHTSNSTNRNHAHIALSVHADTLADRPEAVTATGTLLHHATTDTILCDCVIHRIMRDADNMPTSYGRAKYTVPRSLFRHVAARDGGCRFPGCDRPVSFCDAHHIRYWRHHGRTDLDNLVLLCNRHHHLVHQHDLQVKLLPHGDLHVTWRDGRERISHPRGAPPGRPPT